MSLLDEDLVDKVFLKGTYCVNQYHKLKLVEDWDSTDKGVGVAIIDKDLKVLITIKYDESNYMQALNLGKKKIPTYNQLAIVLSYWNEINECLNKMMLPRLPGNTDFWTCSKYDERYSGIYNERMYTIKKHVWDGYTNIYTGLKWQYETAACIYLEELKL